MRSLTGVIQKKKHLCNAGWLAVSKSGGVEIKGF
jgi:hypothetical protein